MRGEFERPDDRFIAFITLFGVILGAAVIAVVIFET
jgi:hypothetical protein